MSIGVPIPDELLDDLAERVAERVAAKLAADKPPAGYLDAQGAAEYLSAPKGRIYELKERGAIQPHFDGTRLLFRAEQLDAYVEGSA